MQILSSWRAGALTILLCQGHSIVSDVVACRAHCLAGEVLGHGLRLPSRILHRRLKLRRAAVAVRHWEGMMKVLSGIHEMYTK